MSVHMAWHADMVPPWQSDMDAAMGGGRQRGVSLLH